MKTASVRDFRNEFGRISRWLEAGETVQVIKRGYRHATVRYGTPLLETRTS